MYSLIFLKENEEKMEELLFYTVDKNYIQYLSKFESHISYNKDEIYKRANKMYIAITKHKACNFKLLEEKSLNYKNKKWTCKKISQQDWFLCKIMVKYNHYYVVYNFTKIVKFKKTCLLGSHLKEVSLC